MPEELTVKQAAERHNVTVSWLIRNLDQIQHRQIGPMYLVDADSVAAWAKSRPRRGGSQKGVPWSKQRKQKNEAAEGVMAEKAPRARGRKPRQKAEVTQSAASLSRPLSEVVREAKTPPPTSSHTEAPRWQPIDESDQATGLRLQIDALEPGKPFYDASYADGNVQATIHMRPYGTVARAYVMDKNYDRVNASAPGRMGSRQESYAKGLLAALEMRMRQALQAAGWQTEHSSTGSELWRYAQKREGSR